MSGTMVLLHLAGDVALLLWGLHMVRTGFVRAFGGRLRQVLAVGLQSRWKAFLAGLGITALLQSSTATGLMATSFLAGGLMDLVPALAVVLGANVGTTLIVQLLAFDVTVVAPVFVLAGVVAFKRSSGTRARDLGRVGIGIGLILLALHLVIGVIEPVEQAAPLRMLLASLTGDPVMNLAAGALITWAAYSSIAVVLLVMSLASAHIVTPVAALALVLGANLGNVIPQYLAAGDNPAARRLALGNLLMRGFGCLIVLPFLDPGAARLGAVVADPARLIADFHTGFNLALAVVFIGLLRPLAWLCTRLMPETAVAPDPGRPLYIDASTEAPPSVLLSNAAREALRMADVVETMLRLFLDALQNDDRKMLGEIGRLDDALDRLHRAIKLYLTRISRDGVLRGADDRRCSEVLAFVINLEHIGDILDKSLRSLAGKKIKNGLNFSPEGFAEIVAMHAQLVDDLHLAVTVFMTGNQREARALLGDKVHIRDLERSATENHLRRLREGRPESLETSALHLDIVRDLKRIAAHVAAVGYPILDRSGVLRRSRLVDSAEAAALSGAGAASTGPA